MSPDDPRRWARQIALARLVLDRRLTVQQIARRKRRTDTHIGQEIMVGMCLLGNKGDQRAVMVKSWFMTPGIGIKKAVYSYLGKSYRRAGGKA